MAELTLWFQKSWTGSCELERTVFIENPSSIKIASVRGKTGGAYRNMGSFQWTPGVKALVIILLKALTHGINDDTIYEPLLEGERGSLASSLDYALDKQPDWMYSMFGADNNGNAYLRKLILRSNSGIRRGGTVALSLNEQLLAPQSIEVYFKNMLLKNIQESERLLQNIINKEQHTGRESALISCNNPAEFELTQLSDQYTLG